MESDSGKWIAVSRVFYRDYLSELYFSTELGEWWPCFKTATRFDSCEEANHTMLRNSIPRYPGERYYVMKEYNVLTDMAVRMVMME